MTDRALVLLLLAATGGLLLAGYHRYRDRGGSGPERLDVDALELELMAGCCAFIVFTSPGCRPCAAVLRIVERAAAAAGAPTEIRTVDATRRPELAAGYGIRTVPTTFLITASGLVVRRWKDVPEPEDVAAALARL